MKMSSFCKQFTSKCYQCLRGKQVIMRVSSPQPHLCLCIKWWMFERILNGSLSFLPVPHTSRALGRSRETSVPFKDFRTSLSKERVPTSLVKRGEMLGRTSGSGERWLHPGMSRGRSLACLSGPAAGGRRRLCCVLSAAEAVLCSQPRRLQAGPAPLSQPSSPHLPQGRLLWGPRWQQEHHRPSGSCLPPGEPPSSLGLPPLVPPLTLLGNSSGRVLSAPPR